MLFSPRRGTTPVALLLAILSAAHAGAEQQQHLAVLEFDNPQQVKIDRTYFSDLARGAVQKRLPQLFVMTRESTEALMQANGKTLADCTGECEVEVGRQLGADFIISGRITQIGSRLVVTLRLFSTSDARLLDSEEARGKSQDNLLDEADKAIARLVERLAQTLDAARAPAPVAMPSAAAPPAPAPAPAPAPKIAEAPPPAPAPTPASPPSGKILSNAPSAPAWPPFQGTGNYLVESTSFGTGAPTENIRKEGGTEEFAGVRAHYDEEESTVSGTTQTRTRMYFSQTARGIEMLGMRMFLANPGVYTSESETLYTPPMLVAPKSMKKGFHWSEVSVARTRSTTWSAAGAPTENSTDVENTIEGEVTGEESLVIAGQPLQCVAVKESWVTRSTGTNYTSIAKVQSEVRFAASLGLVKMDNDSENTYQPTGKEPTSSKGSFHFVVKEAHFPTPPWFAQAAAHHKR